MKRRVRKIVNFFAFNLLFFALYLNFIHKDTAGAPAVATEQTATQKTAAFSGTVLINSTEKKTEPAAEQPSQQLSVN